MSYAVISPSIGDNPSIDDTQNIQELLNMNRVVALQPGVSYFVRGLRVPEATTLDGRGATILPAIGSGYLIIIGGGREKIVRSVIRHLYITGGSQFDRLKLDDECILISAAEEFLLDNINFESTYTCIRLDNQHTDLATAKGTVRNIFGKWLYRRGIHVGINVHDVLFDDIQFWAGQPHTPDHDPDVGVLIDARNSSKNIAVGGNRFQNVSVLDFNVGFATFQSQMLFFNNCIADNMNLEWGSGWHFDDETDKAWLSNCFVGTSAYGIVAKGKSINIVINSLATWHLKKEGIYAYGSSKVLVSGGSWTGNTSMREDNGRIQLK